MHYVGIVLCNVLCNDLIIIVKVEQLLEEIHKEDAGRTPSHSYLNDESQHIFNNVDEYQNSTFVDCGYNDEISEYQPESDPINLNNFDVEASVESDSRIVSTLSNDDNNDFEPDNISLVLLLKQKLKYSRAKLRGLRTKNKNLELENEKLKSFNFTLQELNGNQNEGRFNCQVCIIVQ